MTPEKQRSLLGHVKLISCLALPARMQKKLGTLNLFIQKLAGRSLLLIISEKKNKFDIYISKDIN